MMKYILTFLAFIFLLSCHRKAAFIPKIGYYLDCYTQDTDPPKYRCDTIWDKWNRFYDTDGTITLELNEWDKAEDGTTTLEFVEPDTNFIYQIYEGLPIQQPEPQIMWIITFEDLLDYQKECYNDSTAYYGNGIDNKVWIHREPTFADFIEWIKKIQASRNEQN